MGMCGCHDEGKNKRLRQAKEEATAEVDQYKLKRESDFRRIQTTIMGSQGNLATKIDEETVQKIQVYNASYLKYKENVMQELLNFIYNVNPEVHVNFKYKL
ncbi:V-type proton ATPase subunit G 3 isoform X2 [Dendropsophus ebraccatus]|uniref:V-type proton ATPase subunit G 3 isoform X2 n=1 Tax=Dendropsophus ebraccatus TaxID=150705 RepID=UPI003831F93E